jgi:hypothetical protein
VADANFSDVALLLHCNGTDASTTFTDSGPAGRTVTVISPAQIDTAQSKYGGASGLFDGETAALTVATATEFVMGSGSFTVEFWMRANSFANFDGDMCNLVNKYDQASGKAPFQIYCDIDNSDKVRAVVHDTTNAEIANILHGTAPSAGTWYHVALVRDGTTFKLYLDGVAAASAPTSSATVKTTSDPVVIGGVRASGSTFAQWDGWIDDIRITKGVARYTANFTPPTAEFEEGVSTEVILAHDAGPLGDFSFTSAVGLDVLLQFDSPLGNFSFLGTNFFFSVEAASPLGDFGFVGFSDFASRLAADALQKHRYFMDLITPGGAVRVPISSWQATQQTGAQCYAGCVIPACDEWLDDLTDATEFVIYRQALTVDAASIEVEAVRCDLDTLQIDQGRTNHTASISGYTDAFAEETAPAAIYDRTLQDIRSVSNYSSGARVRCAIDWMLRPGKRAYYAETSMVVSYINYYVTQNGTGGVEAYMDVGERIA